MVETWQQALHRATRLATLTGYRMQVSRKHNVWTVEHAQPFRQLSPHLLPERQPWGRRGVL